MITLNKYIPSIVLLGSILLGGPAHGALILSFDGPSYTIADVGATADVSVYLSQDATGPQIDADNVLLTAAIRLSYPESGSAGVLSDLDVSFGAGWDSTASFISSDAGIAYVNLSFLSIIGVDDLSAPLLLATLRFTGIAPGSMTATLSDLDPDADDFLTLDLITGDFGALDPTDTATAEITVNSAAVPEPSSALMLGLGAAGLVTLMKRRRAE